MTTTTLEGTLQVDLADVYIWLDKEKLVTAGVDWSDMRFSVDDNALVLSASGREAEHVDAVDFWTWIIENHLPKGMQGWESAFGVPSVFGNEGYYLQVTFAASNETDPRSWVELPACLREWEADTKGEAARPVTLKS